MMNFQKYAEETNSVRTVESKPINELPTIVAMTPLMVRAEQAAKALGVSKRTIQNWAAAGLLPTIRVGEVVGYSVDDLREFIQKYRRQSERKGC